MKKHRYSEALRRVAPIIAEHRNGQEALAELATMERNSDGGDDGFDTAQAVYWVGADYHAGQMCPLYRAMCATKYRPGAIERGPNSHVSVALYETLSWILGG